MRIKKADAPDTFLAHIPIKLLQISALGRSRARGSRHGSGFFRGAARIGGSTGVAGHLPGRVITRGVNREWLLLS